MEAMSNEGPHIRDYEQKSEMLWNEAPKKLKHNIPEHNLKKKNLTSQKKKKTCNFRAHACFEWTAYLNEWESFKTLSQGHNQHGGQDLCPMMFNSRISIILKN